MERRPSHRVADRTMRRLAEQGGIPGFKVVPETTPITTGKRASQEITIATAPEGAARPVRTETPSATEEDESDRARRDAYETLQQPDIFHIIEVIHGAYGMKTLKHLMSTLAVVSRAHRHGNPIEIREIAELPPSTLDVLTQNVLPVLKAIYYFQQHEISVSPSHLCEFQRFYLLLKHIKVGAPETATRHLLKTTTAEPLSDPTIEATILALTYKLSVTQ